MKLAHIVRMLGLAARLIHSGQHTDEELSGVFFSAARLPAPAALSGICGEPRHVQIGRMVEQFGALFTQQRPAAVLVQGDANTVLAGAQAANYAGVPVRASTRSSRSVPRRSSR